MSTNTVTRKAAVTDLKGKCYCSRNGGCSNTVQAPEMLICYVNAHQSYDGKSRTEIGITDIVLNSGICRECAIKEIRRSLQHTASGNQTHGSLAWAILSVLGLIISFMRWVTKFIDLFGQDAKPVNTVIVPSIILLAFLAAAVIFCKNYRSKQRQSVECAAKDLQLTDAELLVKYNSFDECLNASSVTGAGVISASMIKDSDYNAATLSRNVSDQKYGKAGPASAAFFETILSAYHTYKNR